MTSNSDQYLKQLLAASRNLQLTSDHKKPITVIPLIFLKLVHKTFIISIGLSSGIHFVVEIWPIQCIFLVDVSF